MVWWRRGWFLNTLNYLIEKELRESIYKNNSWIDNRWNFVEKQVLYWSKSPIKYAILVIVACLLWMLCLHYWLPLIKEYVPQWSSPWKDIVKWQAPILGGQLTIIGLVFPLVVGFVGIQLQSRSASRALWSIYSRYSAFKFTGLSGLLLAGVIIIGQFTHPWMSNSDVIIFSICISVWFLFNIALVGYFLHATFELMSTKRRNNLVLRYSINETFVSDIKLRLSSLIPVDAVERGVLETNVKDSSSPRVNTILFSRDSQYSYEIKFKKKKYLNNIYFRLLNIAVWFWKLFASAEQVDNSIPELTLPTSNKSYASCDWILASVKGRELSKISKAIIRLSYSFRRSPSSDTSTLKPIINALIGNINDALKEDNVRLFDIAIDEMEDWHNEIAGALSFVNDNGKWDNWLLLREGSFIGGSYLDNLSHEYYQVSRTVIQKIPQTKRYFEIFCYFYIHLYGYKNEKLATQAVIQLIRGHYLVWEALLQWHSNAETAEGNSAYERQYDSVIITFVGSWESWINRLPRISLKNEVTKRNADFHAYYIASTARQIVFAIRLNEKNAAEWAADMLIHWYESAFTGHEPYQYEWQKDLLVFSKLDTTYSDPVWRQILRGRNSNNIDAFQISLKNTWFDVRIVCAAYLLSKPGTGDNKLIFNLVNCLLEEKRLRSTGGVERTHKPIRNGIDIVTAYIRHRWYWEHGDSTYGAWLDGVIESFSRIEKQEYVPGRIYSGWGSNDVRSLQERYIVMAIAYSRREWELSELWLDTIFSDLIELHHREAMLRDFNEWLDPKEDIIEMVKGLVTSQEIDDRISNYKESIKKLIASISERIQKEVTEAEVKPEILKELGEGASLTAFNQRTGKIPLQFFDDIEYADELDEQFRCNFNIGNYSRSDVTESADRSYINAQKESLDYYIPDDITVNIYRKLINNIDFIENKFSNNTEIIKRAILDANEIVSNKMTPILLLGPWDVYQLLDSNLWNYAEESDVLPYQIRRDDGYPESYMCHLEDIEVYRMPFGKINFSILVAKECFNSVTFRRIDDGQYVLAEYIEGEENPIKGKLQLSYWMKVDFHEQCAAYKYISPDEE